MLDRHSPKVPEIPSYWSVTLGDGEQHRSARRKWSCPGDHTIARYADGTLGKHRLAWIERHLSGCLRCRMLVAHALKSQRECTVEPTPDQLMQKAKELTVHRRAPRSSLLIPASALAGIALLIATSMIARKPEPKITRPVPEAPPPPLVARSGPLPPPPSHVPDVIRNTRIPTLTLTLISPQPDSVMSADGLTFSWKPIPHSHGYGVRIVKVDGDLIWEGETATSALQVPPNIAVQDGSYFVWITASLDDGQEVKSAPVHFLVKGSH